MNSVNVVVLSNYINHHQLPFSLTMFEMLNGDYTFIQTEPMEVERLKMGWDNTNDYPFLIKSYENVEKAKKIVCECDVLIIGGINDTYEWLRYRADGKKLSFLCSERIYKNGQWRALSPNGLRMIYKQHISNQKNNVYVLAASAYLPCDLALFHLYKKKIFKWGYFPDAINYGSADNLMSMKQNSKLEILWAGRLIDWKRPELALKAAEWLKGTGRKFHLSIVGNGPLENDLRELLWKNNLDDCVTFCGALRPEEVRRKMEATNIFIATSNYKEGWGAVVNEAMNSGCAVVASHAMGSVPYLIQHGNNGLVFDSNKIDDFLNLLGGLIDKPELIKIYGRNAYRTIIERWNSQIAAKNIILLSETLLNSCMVNISYGPCSKAEVIKESQMLKHIRK